MKNLGYANEWKETPVELTQCSDKNHHIEHEKMGNCLNRFSCSICKYEYIVDSSD